MKIIASSRGTDTELELEEQPLTVLVAQQEFNVTVPDVLEINSDTTITCMKNMSQKAWEHISTGEIFQTFFRQLFGDDAYLPTTIEELNKQNKGIIHGTGLIIQLVESVFEGKTQVFLREPETFLHPQQQQKLMTVITNIRGIKLC